MQVGGGGPVARRALFRLLLLALLAAASIVLQQSGSFQAFAVLVVPGHAGPYLPTAPLLPMQAVRQGGRPARLRWTHVLCYSWQVKRREKGAVRAC